VNFEVTAECIRRVDSTEARIEDFVDVTVKLRTPTAVGTNGTVSRSTLDDRGSRRCKGSVSRQVLNDEKC